MKTLTAIQEGYVQLAIEESCYVVRPGYSVYDDNGLRVLYPNPISRKTRWVPEEIKHVKSFDDLCAEFPEWVGEDEEPSWGSAVYVADDNGFPKLLAENWDTSD